MDQDSVVTATEDDERSPRNRGRWGNQAGDSSLSPSPFPSIDGY